MDRMREVQELQAKADRLLSELEAEEVDEDVTMRGNISRTPEADARRSPSINRLMGERARVQAQLDDLARVSPLVAAARRGGQQRPFRQLNFPEEGEESSMEGSPSRLPYPPEGQEDEDPYSLGMEPSSSLPMRARGSTRRSVAPEFGMGPPPRVVAKRKREGVEPVGMAQRIRYKIGKKIQGLASEIHRLNENPTIREKEMRVYSKSHGRAITLKESRIHQAMREAANLKADLEADGFAQFLGAIPSNRNHYLHAPTTKDTRLWFQHNVIPRLTHEERTGVTQQYVGGSRLGYKYAK
jgi:hypothetical protein